MISKRRAKLKKILYSLKENAKSLSSGFTLENEIATITDLIETGFSTMEYLHVLETKYFISTYIDAETEELNLAQKKASAEFYLYITLIGYLDNKLNSLKKSYERLVKENNDLHVFIVGKIVLTTNFRKNVLENYLSKFCVQEEFLKSLLELDSISTYEELSKNIDLSNLNEGDRSIIKFLLSKESLCENLSEFVAKASLSDENNYIISGFIQAYLEGFKRTDDTDIAEIISFYEKRQKEYFKYKDKCYKDGEEVKEMLQKQNKPLL